jgi:hypothetical protein
MFFLLLKHVTVFWDQRRRRIFALEQEPHINDATPQHYFQALVAFGDWSFEEWSLSEIGRSENGRLRRLVVRRLVEIVFFLT